MAIGGNTALDPFRTPATNCSGRDPSRTGTAHPRWPNRLEAKKARKEPSPEPPPGDQVVMPLTHRRSDTS